MRRSTEKRGITWSLHLEWWGAQSPSPTLQKTTFLTPSWQKTEASLPGESQRPWQRTREGDTHTHTHPHTHTHTLPQGKQHSPWFELAQSQRTSNQSFSISILKINRKHRDQSFEKGRQHKKQREKKKELQNQEQKKAYLKENNN